MSTYLSGDTEREIREALRVGIPLATISQRTGIAAEDLQRLLGLPGLRPVPAGEPDLWADERSEDHP